MEYFFFFSWKENWFRNKLLSNQFLNHSAQTTGSHSSDLFFILFFNCRDFGFPYCCPSVPWPGTAVTENGMGKEFKEFTEFWKFCKRNWKKRGHPKGHFWAAGKEEVSENQRGQHPQNCTKKAANPRGNYMGEKQLCCRGTWGDSMHFIFLELLNPKDLKIIKIV